MYHSNGPNSGSNHGGGRIGKKSSYRDFHAQSINMRKINISIEKYVLYAKLGCTILTGDISLVKLKREREKEREREREMHKIYRNNFQRTNEIVLL